MGLFVYYFGTKKYENVEHHTIKFEINIKNI